MGGSSQTTKSSTTPYKPATQGINDILSGANSVTPFTVPQAATTGIQNSLSSFANGQLPPGLLSAIEDSVSNTVGDRFAKAGRSFSGDFVNAMTKQLVNSEAPYAFQGYSMLPGLMATGATAPYAGLEAKNNLVLPIASAFSNNKSTTTQATDPLQTALGGGLGLLGLLSMGSTGGLMGGLGNKMLGIL